MDHSLFVKHFNSLRVVVSQPRSHKLIVEKESTLGYNFLVCHMSRTALLATHL